MLKSYQNLSDHFRRIHNLENARAILQWDEAVMMPNGSGHSRNQSLAELVGLIQSLTVDPKVKEWLDDAASNADKLNDWEKANLREMNRIYLESTAIPADLLKRLVVARMNCEQKWRQSRAENDWAGFKPFLSEVLSLTREMTKKLAEDKGLSLYDTALSLYSNGLTTEAVEALFAEIKSFLPTLVDKVVERQATEKTLIPEGRFPIEAQRALGLELMQSLGFNFNMGRVDVSHHPFCGGSNRDVRITTRYDESNFASALMGILHETGHALYEQRLPDEWLGQPVGLAAGMAIHESQSLLTEMQICRSPEFLHFAAPIIRKHLGKYVTDLRSLEPENLVRFTTRVRRGFIRVDADEVTYPAHVILRYELERALLEDTLSIDDLPDAWHGKMMAYLHISTNGNDRDGCMQDVHWPSGSFGYFPAYTFGAVIAAQLFSAISSEHPGAKRDIARGDFGQVQSWLDKNIWSNGSRLTTLDLVSAASGPLSSKPFRKHLEERYLL